MRQGPSALRRMCRRGIQHPAPKSTSAKRKSLTSVWGRSTFSTKKASTSPACSTLAAAEAAEAAEVAGAAVAGPVALAVVAAVAVAVAAFRGALAASFAD